MKRTFFTRRTISILLATVLLFGTFSVFTASAKTKYKKSGKYRYCVLDDGTIKLVEYYGKKQSINLPSKLDDKTVTELGDYAIDSETINTVTIPASIKKISGRAFGDYCCVKKFKVKADSRYFSSDSDGVLYNKDKTTLVHYPCGKTDSVYTVRASVKAIADCAFNSASVKQINLPEGLESIGFLSFSDCPMKSIKFPSTLQSIGELAFSGCPFKSLEFPTSLKKIGKRAFSFIPFEDNSKSPLVSVKLNEGLEEIGKCAFEDTSIKSVEIPSTVKKLAYDAFYGSKLEKLTVAENSPYFCTDSSGALYNKSKTKLIGFQCASRVPESFTVPDGVKEIGRAAFYDGKLKSVKLPDTLETIGTDAFFCCKLKSVVIPKSVRTIGSGAFMNLSERALTSVTLNEGLRTIGQNAFTDAPIKSIKIPSTVTGIGDDAFSDTKLGEIDIPGSVKRIGACCFEFCVNLRKVTLRKGLEQIGERAFEFTSVGKINLPSTLKSIGDGAFSDTKITSVKIPKSLKTLGKEVFASDVGGGKLSKITVAKGNKYFSARANVLYNKNKTEVLYCAPKRPQKNYTTPKTVKKIAQKAFCASRFDNFTITGNVREISKYAFEYTRVRKSFKIKNGIKKINGLTFYYTSVGNGWKLKLPKSVKTIQPEAFYASNLCSVNIPPKLREIKPQAFFGTDLDELTIPPTVKKIGKAAFGYTVGECGTIGEPIKSFVIKGKKGTAAEKFAEKTGMKFVSIY